MFCINIKLKVIHIFGFGLPTVSKDWMENYYYYKWLVAKIDEERSTKNIILILNSNTDNTGVFIINIEIMA